ncbi:hypothetical protein G9F71_026480 [Clostridium sp. FP2]|uniref:hypothetical protein n=1 Tax=Clostridium sp. FP2 TaxID=2724481 RepID=UPI0013E909D7|nr:hypothetical protein [Clostridium sp. FP2]MBZ9626354.1 hypothetical protein [Clostridium sp. FP2]
MINKLVEKDERTTSVENASYKIGFHFMTYAIFLDVMYRCIRFHEGSFDLILIILLSCLPAIIYQYKKKIYPKNMIRNVALMSVIIAIFSFLLAVVIKKFLN